MRRRWLGGLSLAVLAGCGDPTVAEDLLAPTSLTVVWTELPAGFELDQARLRVSALLLDRCGGTLTLVPVDSELVSPNGEEPAAFLLPGGYCGLHLVLDDGADLQINGHLDGEPVFVELELAGLAVLEPFLVGMDQPVLLVVPLERLEDADELIVASLWLDRDRDGQLGPADEPASFDQG